MGCHDEGPEARVDILAIDKSRSPLHTPCTHTEPRPAVCPDLTAFCRMPFLAAGSRVYVQFYLCAPAESLQRKERCVSGSEHLPTPLPTPPKKPVRNANLPSLAAQQLFSFKPLIMVLLKSPFDGKKSQLDISDPAQYTSPRAPFPPSQRPLIKWKMCCRPEVWVCNYF